ncbi:hypothetical protein EDD37DRAFT_75528 [Exophiala viscosa]|uniref:uncharacterized protein n=1 Tax=Exophiala viscosa TaxID=2486360 RepID=UPI0021A15369|nr:hypothetical protein EDD37DRAFT_75528 [Exophiala viscosa]
MEATSCSPIIRCAGSLHSQSRIQLMLWSGTEPRVFFALHVRLRKLHNSNKSLCPSRVVEYATNARHRYQNQLMYPMTNHEPQADWAHIPSAKESPAFHGPNTHNKDWLLGRNQRCLLKSAANYSWLMSIYSLCLILFVATFVHYCEFPTIVTRF